MWSAPRALDRSPVSDAATTRSGRYPAIASTFGSNPESFVVGACAGWFDWSSTATTCGPAPIANSISVAVGESDTMRAGRAGMSTAPFDPFTVSGNAEGVVAGVDDAAGVWSVPHAEASTTTSETAHATRAFERDKTSSFSRRMKSGPAAFAAQVALQPRPIPRRGAGDLARPRHPKGGASQLRDSAGFPPASLTSTPLRAPPEAAEQ